MQRVEDVTTIGELISQLCTKYARLYQDEHFAELATQVTIDELLRSRQVLATGKIA